MVSADALRESQFFGGLSDEALQSLADIARPVSFEEGATIFHQSTPASTLYLLLDGWVDIVMGNDVHDELLTALSRGDIFGWSAIVEPYVYTSSARCATPVSALAFAAGELLALFQADARLCYTLMNRTCRVVASRLRATQLQLASLFVAREGRR